MAIAEDSIRYWFCRLNEARRFNDAVRPPRGERVDRRRERDGDRRKHRARTPCPECGTADAVLLIRNRQATVRCARCDRFLYNAPRTETGDKPRTVKTLRRSIRPKQQARILDRDRGRCVLCGSKQDLTIAHLLSIEDGVELGAAVHHLYDDANLAAMCEACNIGLHHGPKSVNPRTYIVILFLLVQVEMSRGAQTALDLGLA